jgi:hypothetical protein
MVAQRSYLESATGCRWLIPAAETASLAGGRWPPAAAGPALARWARLPLIATRPLSADPGSAWARTRAGQAATGPGT